MNADWEMWASGFTLGYLLSGQFRLGRRPWAWDMWVVAAAQGAVVVRMMVVRS